MEQTAGVDAHMRRVSGHPVLDDVESNWVTITWSGRATDARAGEPISSALTAAGVDILGRHPRDAGPLGLFCANGQCASCLVMVDGVPTKSCTTGVRHGMEVWPIRGLPTVPIDGATEVGATQVVRIEALVIGAGPAGLAAAAELGAAGVETVIVEDKPEAGGKLVLQTHKFFGSRRHTSAGVRGIEIARRLTAELEGLESVELWSSAAAVGVFGDGRIGVVRDGHYWLIEPRVVLVATGAREQQLVFPGHTLPGVVGAGAFQTLVNRDRVRPCRRLVVIGAGNVGLIAAYHALQAGIAVAGVFEMAERIGGYRVHADKLRRLGVPIHLRSTIVAAHGSDRVDSVTVCSVDREGQPVAGTERTDRVDMVLVAAGLSPITELAIQARECGLTIFTAGDADRVSEASAASFDGRSAGRRMLAALGHSGHEVSAEWTDLLDRLRAGPGPIHESQEIDPGWEVFPVLRCTEEIPCNPCAEICRRRAIALEGDSLRGVPKFSGVDCTACHRCVAVCPGQAITVVDRREDVTRPIVTLPFELDPALVQPGRSVTATDADGVSLGDFEVVGLLGRKSQQRTRLVQLAATPDTAPRIAGIRVQDPEPPLATTGSHRTPDDVIVCRCEHVTAGEVRDAIRSGVTDVNELKAMLRVCMGACCGTNCPGHIQRLYREEGFDAVEITSPTLRPLAREVPLATLAAGSGEPQ